jgi:hypothetical protein
MKNKSAIDIWSIVGALMGTALIIGIIVFVGLQLQRMEAQADRLYQSGVIVELELDGLKTELLALESVMRAASADADGSVEVAGIEYTRNEVDYLQKELENYKDMIQVKRDTLTSVELSKQSLFMDVHILFWASVFFLLVGVVAAVLGYLSWFHKLRIFRDRRQGPRVDDLEVFREKSG